MTTAIRTRHALGLTLAAAMLSLAACGGGDGDAADSAAEASSAEQSEQSDQTAGDAADLEGIPDVVAEVNGEEVTKEEFAPIYQAQLQQATMQAQMSGEKPDEEALKEQTADDLVDTELLAQEAESRGIEVTDQDVDDELASIAEDNQMGSADELLEALEQQGTTEDQARAQLETQVMIEQLVADEAGPAKATEKELRALYQQAKEQQAQMGQQGGQQQEIPPYEKVKPQLEEQAESQRVGTVATELVEQLREDADITINL
ncbi:SurA N-terminal domain-containing protein [Nocardioides sediminis]|uniref:SurA N-terminal domain-containing protein n=1 Tax=Nocardioides sediminis TaxID=433648 RepID=UPI00131F101C|nr:SurA N-terminal domain-containing protein [Nocardioides sediminis]